MKKNYLCDLYYQYSNGIIKKSDFTVKVYQYLVKNKNKTFLSNWVKNDYDDYISWFYTRLRKAIDSYKESVSSFDIYINSVLRLTAKEYRVKKTTNSVIEYSAWCVHAPDLYVFEETPSYIKESREKKPHFFSEKKGRKNTKELLTLLLKCYYYVSNELLDKAAEYTGIDRNELELMINKMRAMRQKRDDEIYLMRERVYCQYCRCIVYEKRLKYLCETSISYLKLKHKLEKARKRLSSMRKRLKSVRTDATNKEIAEVIGTTKGTVDASLYKLKTKWEKLADKSMLN